MPRVATQLWQVLLQFSKTSINMILGIDQNPVQGFLLPISPNRSQSDQRNCSDASSALLSSSSSMAQPSLSSWTTTSSSPSCPRLVEGASAIVDDALPDPLCIVVEEGAMEANTSDHPRPARWWHLKGQALAALMFATSFQCWTH